MKYDIIGSSVQMLSVTLAKGESVYSSPRFVSLLNDKIDVNVKAKGGLKKSFKRMMTGEAFKMAVMEAKDDNAQVGFSTETAGKILPLEVDENKEYICDAEAFICAEVGVNLDLYIPNKSFEGFKSGEGFVMQKLSGKGLAFVESDGDVTELELTGDEKIKVDSYHIVAWESTVDVELEFDKELKKQFTILKGQGKVWIQTYPVAVLAKKIKTVNSVKG